MYAINYSGVSFIIQTRSLNHISWLVDQYAVRQEVAKLTEATKSETRDTVFPWFKELVCRTFHWILFENWDYLELLVCLSYIATQVAWGLFSWGQSMFEVKWANHNPVSGAYNVYKYTINKCSQYILEKCTFHCMNSSFFVMAFCLQIIKLL